MQHKFLTLKDSLIYRAFDICDALNDDLILSVLRQRSGGSKRLPIELFKQSKITCKCCGVTASIVLQYIHKSQLNKNKSSTYDIFAIKKTNKDIHLVMMTIDHIIPKSLGGAPIKKTNLQWMCEPCNRKKSNDITKNDWNIIVDVGIENMLANSSKRKVFLQDSHLMQEYWMQWIRIQIQKASSFEKRLWSFVKWFTHDNYLPYSLVDKL